MPMSLRNPYPLSPRSQSAIPRSAPLRSSGPSHAQPSSKASAGAYDATQSDPKLALLLANEDLSSSTETVRGPPIVETAATPPLTPFPPWLGDSEPEEPRTSTITGGSSTERGRGVSWDKRLHKIALQSERRRMRRSVMHSVVLAMQCAAALAVFSVSVGATVWQRDESTAEFWDW